MISDAGSRPVRHHGSSDGAETDGKTIGLDEYLASCDNLFRIADRHAVCLKNSQAYSRTLYYEDVSYDEAKMLFVKQKLTSAETKKIQDFMFHYIIRKAIEYDLPVQIHTGYLAGNGNMLENSNPLNLNNLFLKYRDAEFILFHGGFPWTGECAAMAKMFPNVYLDLVWLPQISRQQAISALDVMLDCVPCNKFCWGGDCHFIEESAGSLEFGKDVVSEVLANRVKRGLMTEEVAINILERIFRINAMEIFDNYFNSREGDKESV
jgi:predicted TIM-barrel fold metal-dependent hydrolase